ncbi:Nudix hydrolase 8 [Dendrobium catenatum]|uniref:Nudix hydrolase 8 n=1 Tax=Dendrobium catenatum TaxID=906689 RepID=A0A2I0WT48_9ASPA|nr:Nudix hydrolase 8 [Dendrobium catenatum]
MESRLISKPQLMMTMEVLFVELKVPIHPKAFETSLKLSTWCWRQQGIKGVWIKLPIELASLVQIIVKVFENFLYI